MWPKLYTGCMRITTYLSQPPPHWCTASQRCCWSHSGTCPAGPASHAESEMTISIKAWHPLPQRRITPIHSSILIHREMCKAVKVDSNVWAKLLRFHRDSEDSGTTTAVPWVSSWWHRGSGLHFCATGIEGPAFPRRHTPAEGSPQRLAIAPEAGSRPSDDLPRTGNAVLTAALGENPD